MELAAVTSLLNGLHGGLVLAHRLVGWCTACPECHQYLCMLMCYHMCICICVGTYVCAVSVYVCVRARVCACACACAHYVVQPLVGAHCLSVDCVCVFCKEHVRQAAHLS